MTAAPASSILHQGSLIEARAERSIERPSRCHRPPTAADARPPKHGPANRSQVVVLERRSLGSALACLAQPLYLLLWRASASGARNTSRSLRPCSSCCAACENARVFTRPRPKCTLHSAQCMSLKLALLRLGREPYRRPLWAQERTSLIGSVYSNKANADKESSGPRVIGW